MRHVLLLIATSSSLLALSQTAVLAQAPGDEAVPPPPPPATCTPSCRSGYVCVEGTCVSQCNPPCGAGERCHAGECEALPRAVPPGEIDWSAPPERRPGVETHDGFMLRLALGLGYGVVTDAAEGATTFKLRGTSGSFSIDVGAAVTENAVIHARISDFFLIDPTVSVNGRDQGDVSASIGGVFVGPAFTYYFMPINLSLTGAVGVSWVRATNGDEDTDYTSNLGLGLNADLGKEWWVSDNWGLGVAARFWYTHATDKEGGLDITFDVSGFAILFSATYQ